MGSVPKKAKDIILSVDIVKHDEHNHTDVLE